MIQEHQLLARRITRTLFIAQSLGSAGFIAANTVGGIVAANLSGTPAWAGVPTAVFLVGGALAAYGWGYTSDRWGRRGALVIGLILGMVGAALSSGAVLLGVFGVMLVGSLLMGAAQSGLTLSRFAAAEVHPVAERGRAIAQVVMGSTVGAIFGPLTVGPVGAFMRRLSLDELAGPYMVSIVLFAVTATLVWVRLRPDPRDLGREIERLNDPEQVSDEAARPLANILSLPGTRLAIAAMGFGQLTMVMVMVMTSVHMRGHQHGLSSISMVLSSHFIGMFAFSIIAGQLADRWGRRPVIVTGGITLVIACLLAPLSPSVFPLAFALFLLGLGWNFCFVAGSALLADQLRPVERARTQGFNDLLIGLVSATGSLGSGLAFAAFGYASMALAGAAFAVVPLVLALLNYTRPSEPVRGSTG